MCILIKALGESAFGEEGNEEEGHGINIYFEQSCWTYAHTSHLPQITNNNNNDNNNNNNNNNNNLH